MSDYRYVQEAPPGQPLKVTVNMTGYQPFAVSGHVDEGRYKLRIIGSELAQASEGARGKRNHKVTLTITAPEDQAGVTIVTNDPAPGTIDKNGRDIGEDRIKRLLHAVALTGGRPELLDGEIEIGIGGPSASLIGKEICAYVMDGNDPRYSSVDRFVTPEEFAAAPGPAKGVMRSSPSAAGAGPAQPIRPEVAPQAAGNGGGGVDAMKALLKRAAAAPPVGATPAAAAAASAPRKL